MFELNLNIVITKKDHVGMEALKCLITKFENKEFDKLIYLLGIEVTHSHHGIHIFQQKCVGFIG